jgi:hypothetical protein
MVFFEVFLENLTPIGLGLDIIGISLLSISVIRRSATFLDHHYKDTPPKTLGESVVFCLAKIFSTGNAEVDITVTSEFVLQLGAWALITLGFILQIAGYFR